MDVPSIGWPCAAVLLLCNAVMCHCKPNSAKLRVMRQCAAKLRVMRQCSAKLRVMRQCSAKLRVIKQCSAKLRVTRQLHLSYIQPLLSLLCNGCCITAVQQSQSLAMAMWTSLHLAEPFDSSSAFSDLEICWLLTAKQALLPFHSGC